MHLIYLVLGSIFLSFLGHHFFGGPRIRRNGHPLRRPPNTIPLIGNGLHFLKDRHELFSWFVKCERHFGYDTFEISVPSLPPGVVINDPRNIEFVLKNEGIFSKGAFFKQRSWDLFGNGIINADGELWKVQRKAGLDFLSKSKLNVLLNEALPQYLEAIVANLNSIRSEQVLNLETVFHELTTQLMGQMAYGMEMHADDSFSRSFEYASGATGKRVQNPLWPLWEVFFGQELRRAVKEVKLFGSSIVANAVKARDIIHEHTINDDKRINDMSGSLINSLLDSISDHQMVADAALNYLSAGRDTTAQALTWTFYLLMRNPLIVSRLHGELLPLAITPSDGQSSLELSLLRPINLPYTMAIFYESLRLYPPVPIELKQCEQATTLPDETFLPNGAIVVWCIWAMNRSKLTWGEDAEKFRPERWLEDGKLVTRPAHEFPVFNGGPRTCLGKKMAESMAVMAIARLVWEFDFVAIDEKERISKNSLTLPMEGGLPCYVKRRKTLVDKNL